ncbi:hypothetical protein [Gymnodinialimonas ceratoperidinii]|uniref:Uncharacterized protein n=1 Tax=Gymnodinialimonas ceratoperidinii TaxID=2856823 RepID=A0A8F6YBY0_9RHOB|nr:hypothetical protein [Gymnodinialimonas ceratoperidinii]QXT40626.1 hypothetical protein KYE46_05145 [Gymnodinialimonas ceratoperidinii]
MKVTALYDSPVELELVAHFLGMAAHDNDNAPPRHSLRTKASRMTRPLLTPLLG